MAKKDNKEKRISVNQFEKTKRDCVTIVPYAINDEEALEIVVKTVLSFEDMLRFVSDVVSIVVDVDDGTYMPEVEEFAIRKAVLKYYANFNMPQSVAKAYDIIFNSGVYNVVIGVIDEDQFKNIRQSIRRKVQHKANMIASEAAQRVNDLIMKIDEVTNLLNNSFGGIDGEELASLVRKFSEVESIDEREIANAVLDRMDGASQLELKLVNAESTN